MCRISQFFWTESGSVMRCGMPAGFTGEEVEVEVEAEAPAPLESPGSCPPQANPGNPERDAVLNPVSKIESIEKIAA